MAKDTDPFDQSRERTMVLRPPLSRQPFFSMESIRTMICAVFLRRIIKSIPRIVIQRF
jgi:hypothetical protein